MPIYVCEHCDYETKHQATMMRHLKKIRPCSMQRILVNLEIMKLIKTQGLAIIKLQEDPLINIKELI